MDEAELVYRSILAKEPRHPEALKYLGVLAGQLGHHDQALELLRMAQEGTPTDPEIHVNRGLILQQRGQPADAQVAYQEALRLRPQWPQVLTLLGDTLHAQGLFQGAIEQYRKALDLEGDLLPAMGNMAAAFKDLGQWDQAADCCRRMIELSPQLPDAYLTLAIVLGESGKLQEAVDQVKRALEVDDKNPDAWDLLGQLLTQQGKLPEAAGCHLHAISLNQNVPRYHANLGDALLGQGHVDNAIDAYRHALSLNPRDAQVHSRLLVAMGQSEKIQKREVFEEAVNWGRQHAHPVPKFDTYANGRDPQRIIRVGYVSPAFSTVKAGALNERILTSHDPARVEVFCYSDARQSDQVSPRIKSAPNVKWRDMAGLPDERFCQTVREDRIDILVDLVGHLPANRLLALGASARANPGELGLSPYDGDDRDRLSPDQHDHPARCGKALHEKLFRLTTNDSDLVRDLERAYRRMWATWCSEASGGRNSASSGP
jgi:tetratricopeptide (TPR) repeat protein